MLWGLNQQKNYMNLIIAQLSWVKYCDSTTLLQQLIILVQNIMNIFYCMHIYAIHLQAKQYRELTRQKSNFFLVVDTRSTLEVDVLHH